MARAVTPDEVMRAVIEIMGVRWVWGVSDCSAAACDVFNRLHGIDPLRPIRGSYSTAIGARRIQGRDWAAKCIWLAQRAGLRETDGNTGDLALVESERGLSLAIGIHARQWAGKTAGGFATVQYPVIAWGI